MPVTTLIARYGVLAIFLGAGLEGEAVVVTGGILAHRGLIPLAGAIAAAICGSFLVDQLWFLLGRHARHYRFIRKQLERPSATRVIHLLERYPTAFIFGFRFVYGLRTVSPIAIGATTVRTLRFVALNILAAAIWGTLFTLVGYCLGPAVDPLLSDVRHGVIVAGAALFPIAIVVAAIYAARRRRDTPVV